MSLFIQRQFTTKVVSGDNKTQITVVHLSRIQIQIEIGLIQYNAFTDSYSALWNAKK